MYYFAAAYAVIVFVTLSVLNDWWLYPARSEYRGGWLFEYQGLLGGVLALIGAATTVWYLRRQVLDASRSAERARRVNIASGNQRLIHRIEEVCDNLREATNQVAADGPDSTDLAPIMQVLPPGFGVELDLIEALGLARTSISAAGFRFEHGESADHGAVVSIEPGTVLEIMGPVNRFISLATSIGRLLAMGWTPLELSRRSADDIIELGEPPGLA